MELPSCALRNSSSHGNLTLFLKRPLSYLTAKALQTEIQNLRLYTKIIFIFILQFIEKGKHTAIQGLFSMIRSLVPEETTYKGKRLWYFFLIPR